MLSLFVFLLITISSVYGECDKKVFDRDSFVCVCDSEHCDFPGSIRPPDRADGSYKTIVSSRDEFRFNISTGMSEKNPTAGATIIHMNQEYQYQKILGFGGAFTDATGLNILTLSEAAQENLVKSYFSPEGIEYNICRIPIAGSDFSTRPYSYDDVPGDTELENFALTEEDYMYKLPFIKKAQNMSTRTIKLYASPWAPPAWMKENGMFNGTGGLLKEMWQPWANYFVKFVQAYKTEGITLWGLTTQNEPLTGFEDWQWNTCAWSAEDMRDWVAYNLGPTLTAEQMRDIKLMIVDNNRDALPWYAVTCFENTEANSFIDGTGVHWYNDRNVDPSVLTETAALFPDKFMLYTESSAGYTGPLDDRVRLGDWERADQYAFSMIEAITHDQAGWVDWNMALDMQGGPNWANNFLDCPIIVNKDMDEFYKQPMFYAMGHFSKFMLPDAVHVYTSVTGETHIYAAAVNNIDESTAVIVLNSGDEAEDVSVETGTHEYMNIELPPKSITTILYRLD